MRRGRIHGHEVAAGNPLAADAEAAELPRLEPHELLAGPRGVGPVGGVEVRRQVVPRAMQAKMRVISTHLIPEEDSGLSDKSRRRRPANKNNHWRFLEST